MRKEVAIEQQTIYVPVRHEEEVIERRPGRLWSAIQYAC
jgi:uncharacterized protein (TIGR02271 family)